MSQLERKSSHLLLRASANPRTPYSAAAHWWHMRSREVAEAEVQAAEADTQIQIDICIYLLRQHIRHHASVERCFGRRLLTPARGTLVTASTLSTHRDRHCSLAAVCTFSTHT